MSESIQMNELDALKAVVENLQQEVTRLRAEQNMAIVPANEPTSRRRMLKKLGIGAAAAGLAVTGMAASNMPEASANSGDPLILGKNAFTNTPNVAQNTTHLRITQNKDFTPGAFVAQVGTTNLVDLNAYGAVIGMTDGTAPDGTDKVSSGVAGVNTSTQSTGVGVIGSSNSGIGVKGLGANIGVEGSASSAGGTGVYGEGKFAGIYGTSSQGSGIVGETFGKQQAGIVGKNTYDTELITGFGGNTGVQGVSLKGSGVVGYGFTGVEAITEQENGTALYVRGNAKNTTGVRIQQFQGGVALNASTNDGIGVVSGSGNVHAQIWLIPNLRRDPLSLAESKLPHKAGELMVDSFGILWACVKDGTPGDWRKLAGIKTAGQLHVLPTPERLIDTRSDLVGANDPKGQVVGFAPADKPAAASTFSYTITERAGSNGDKVPAGAIAITGNVTVVANDTAPSGGFLTMWPAGGAVPATSILNYKPGQIAFNNFTAGLSADGKLSVASFRNVHVIIDVTGYYL